MTYYDYLSPKFSLRFEKGQYIGTLSTKYKNQNYALGFKIDSPIHNNLDELSKKITMLIRAHIDTIAQLNGDMDKALEVIKNLPKKH